MDYKALEEFFTVQDSGENEIECKCWTDGGVDMSFYISKDEWLKDFRNYVWNFDVDELIDFYRDDPEYVKHFTVSQSLKDFTDHKEYLDNCLSKLMEEK